MGMGTYLVHHGIKGQKWGERNGPPYPLGEGDHSAREKRAGWKSSLSNKVKEKTSGLTEEQKEYLKTGLKIAGVVLAAYATYKVLEYSTAKDIVSYIDTNGDIGETLFDRDLLIQAKLSDMELNDTYRKTLMDAFEDMDLANNSDKQIQSLNDLEMWEPGENTVNASIAITNPSLSTFTAGVENPIKISILAALNDVDPGYYNNCQFCSVTYEMNRRGYKCSANYRETGGIFSDLGRVFDLSSRKSDNIMEITHKGLGNFNAKNFASSFEKYGNGARGNLVVWWKAGGGHAMAWENIDGHFTVIDAQTGYKYSSMKDLNKLFGRAQYRIQSLRTDNLKLIPDSEELLQIVTSYDPFWDEVDVSAL